jgi:prepilin-type N-terminal cleavage/methylation domain-containing protein
MNRLRSQGGFTLVELLVSIMVLVLLVVAMGTGMTTALRVYQESVFQSNSENLASMLNATLEDMFQYSKNIYVREDTNSPTFKQVKQETNTLTVDDAEGVDMLFSNSEYGATNAYIFVNDNSTDEDANPVQFKNVSNNKVKDVLNIGAYPNLGVKDLIITYTNGVFNIEYTIYSTKDANSELKVKDAVSMLNQ